MYSNWNSLSCAYLLCYPGTHIGKTLSRKEQQLVWQGKGQKNLKILKRFLALQRAIVHKQIHSISVVLKCHEWDWREKCLFKAPGEGETIMTKRLRNSTQGSFHLFPVHFCLLPDYLEQELWDETSRTVVRSAGIESNCLDLQTA